MPSCTCPANFLNSTDLPGSVKWRQAFSAISPLFWDRIAWNLVSASRVRSDACVLSFKFLGSKLRPGRPISHLRVQLTGTSAMGFATNYFLVKKEGKKQYVTSETASYLQTFSTEFHNFFFEKSSVKRRTQRCNSVNSTSLLSAVNGRYVNVAIFQNLRRSHGRN
jgi:hypothetical protein